MVCPCVIRHPLIFLVNVEDPIREDVRGADWDAAPYLHLSGMLKPVPYRKPMNLDSEEHTESDDEKTTVLTTQLRGTQRTV